MKIDRQLGILSILLQTESFLGCLSGQKLLRKKKTLQHCGECKDFPCTQLNEFAYAEKEGDCGVRLDQCKIWSALTQMRYAWIDDFLMKKTGVTK